MGAVSVRRRQISLPGRGQPSRRLSRNRKGSPRIRCRPDLPTPFKKTCSYRTINSYYDHLHSGRPVASRAQSGERKREVRSVSEQSASIGDGGASVRQRQQAYHHELTRSITRRGRLPDSGGERLFQHRNGRKISARQQSRILSIVRIH